jgi:hypothetical protein
MVIDNSLEPSHRLVDSVAQQLENSRLQYVHWSQCTSREQEVQGIKTHSVDDKIVMETDKSGVLKAKSADADQKADTSSDLLLTHALMRRALAFEVAGLARFETMEKLHSKLIREYMAPPLEGFKRVSLVQVERADRYAFNRMAELTAGSLAPAGGVFPLATALNTILNEPKFLYMLMPLPGNSKESAKAEKENPKADHKPEPKAKAGKGGKGGKGSGQKAEAEKKRKTVAKTKDGKRICFNYQKQKGCADAQDGAECSRGMHVCWMRDCQQAHPGHKHPK